MAQELGFLKTCEENSFSECTECDIYVDAMNRYIAIPEVGASYDFCTNVLINSMLC